MRHSGEGCEMISMPLQWENIKKVFLLNQRKTKKIGIVESSSQSSKRDKKLSNKIFYVKTFINIAVRLGKLAFLLTQMLSLDVIPICLH